MRGLFSTVIVIAVAMGVICGCTSEKSDVSVVAPDGTGSVAEREEPSFGIADEYAVENPENAIADISVEEPDDIESEASDTDPKENEQVTKSINLSLDSAIEEHNQDTEFVKISKSYIDIISDEEFECDECGLIYLDDSGYPNLIVKSDQGLYPFYSIYRIDHGNPVCIYEGGPSGGLFMGVSYYEKQGIISEAARGFRGYSVCEWVSRLVDNEFQTVCRIDYDDPGFENISEDEIDSKLNWYIEVDGHKTYMSRNDCYEEMKKYEGYGNPKQLFDDDLCISKDYMLAKLKSIYNTQNQTDNEAIENSSYKDLMCDAIDDAINQYWESNQLDDWKDKEEYTENTRFYLLYIDNDDKPEILITPASGMIDGSSILYIKDAVVESYFIESSDSITYIPNSGVICIYHGLHMPTTEKVMSFPDQTVLGEGEFCDAGWYGEKANPVDGSDTIYIWNGETLSEEEYLSQKEAVFSGDIHEAWNEDAYTYEEVTIFLDGFDNE